MKRIKLTTKEELKIYINPTRQQMLHLLSTSKQPMTSKRMADKLAISASSIQHHLNKLMALELVELDHTEVINGIVAKYYKAAPVTVQIGLDKDDDTATQRHVFLQEAIALTYDRFRERMKEVKAQVSGDDEALPCQWGDVLTGVMHLDQAESRELMKMVCDYIETHASPSRNTTAWEYALILFKAED